MNVKPLGQVEPAPAPHRGFVVRVTRYPNGRLLPEARILLDTSGAEPAPFATAFRALEALNRFCADPRSCQHIELPRPKRPRKPKAKAPVTSRDEAPRRPLVVRHKKVLPVVRLFEGAPAQCLKPRDALSQEIDNIVSSLTEPITYCRAAPARGVHELYRKTGGVVPGHLNPLTMGDNS